MGVSWFINLRLLMKALLLFSKFFITFAFVLSNAYSQSCSKNLIINISKKEKVCFDSLEISKKNETTFDKSLKKLVNDNIIYAIAISSKNNCEGVGFSNLVIGGHAFHVETVKRRYDEALNRCQNKNGCPCKILLDSGSIIDEDLFTALATTRADTTQITTNKESSVNNNSTNNQINPPTSTNNTLPISLQVTATEPDAAGATYISVQSNVSTASLKINDEEQGGDTAGKYSIKKFAMIGKPTTFTIVATDSNGNTGTKTVTVTRKAVDSAPVFAQLNPNNIKEHSKRDAVAIIIGIQDYKRLARAEYANTDAQLFYDYAVRALGIPAANIKLLLDADADQVDVYKALRNWLPAKVNKGKTDVYVFYSGHGLPAEDGKSLYLLPYGADKDFLDKTAISQQEINTMLQAAQAKSITLFLDSCYSGQTRTGETLLASARPIALKAQTAAFPPDFTVIAATAPEQLSWSSTDLKHGIFSYYLMKGMEGDADLNKDGVITLQEMQNYLTENVARQAQRDGRTQLPQLQGDGTRVFVAK